MNVKCPNCRYKFDVDAVVGDDNMVTCVCPRCGNKFAVEPAPGQLGKHDDVAQSVQPPHQTLPAGSPVAETQVQPEPVQQPEPEVRYVYVKDNEDKPNYLPWIIAGLVAALLILGVGGWIWYDNERTKRAELEHQLAVQAEQARQDSIAKAIELERIRQDSIRQAQERERTQKVQAAYVSLVDSYNARYGENYPNSYFLYDITGDGMPELWIQAGTCEADYEMHIYTIADGVPRKIHSTGFDHAGCYRGKNYILITHMHMGYAWWSKISYNGSKIVEQTVLEQECDEYTDYPEPSEPYVTTYLQTEHDPIYTFVK